VEIYDAIMKAADQIEHVKGAWRWSRTTVPDCGSPGCMIGWIAYYLGERPGTHISQVMQRIGCDPMHGGDEFYQIVGELSGLGRFGLEPASGAEIAAALRLYAAKYHAPKPHFTGLPDIVRDIFTRQPVAKGEDTIIQV
jgi:hypothetical protein